ncbi:hypothetical protein PROFUN_09873 [Planoprotostelium fungivorum]|uniref:Uncharacterized protein n=1 Tax=Planoprotostelium fungivorum TaxID=1890364 RepID=A0A2P6NGD3_9EUKA|nr:hypothetical protein PROFUN_09873 [Planoprotostelium fungivorum]
MSRNVKGSGSMSARSPPLEHATSLVFRIGSRCQTVWCSMALHAEIYKMFR